VNVYNTHIKQDKQQPDTQNNGGPKEAAETLRITKTRTTTKQTKKRRKKKRNSQPQPHI
jgi:hypothetical protein